MIDDCRAIKFSDTGVDSMSASPQSLKGTYSSSKTITTCGLAWKWFIVGTVMVRH